MLSALSLFSALATLSAVRLDIRAPKTYLKEAESNALPYLQDDFLVELLEFKKFGQPNGFFVGTEPTAKLDSRFSRSISLIVSNAGYEALRGYVYAKHKPSELVPLYTTGENDVGILSTNKSAVHLSYLLGYCSPKLGYFGATVPLFGEFDGPLTLNPLSGRDNNCQNVRRALCYGWAKTARYHVKDLLTAEDTMETLTYSKLANSFVPLMPTNPDSVTTCAQLGSTLNQVDVKNGLGRICDSLVPLYSLRNKKWWYRTFTVKPDPAVHTILGDKLHNIVGYCATVKGDCYANAALYIIGENQKKERFEIAEKSTGQFLCYVW